MGLFSREGKQKVNTGGSYLFFDVETPNTRNSKICAIGVVYCVPGKRPQEFFSLVNPETGFATRNIRIHGICPDDVIRAPTFDRLWFDTLEPMFCDSVLVAHNAIFDLNVLAKTLRFYDLEPPDYIYSCTLEMSRRYYPEVGDHRLPTVCEYLGIPLFHHNAMSDARGCWGIFDQTFRRFGQNAILVEKYAVPPKVTSHSEKGAASRIQTLTTGALASLLEMVACDGRVSVQEATTLLDWLFTNESMIPSCFFDSLTDRLSSALEDGVITLDEEEALLGLFKHLLEPAGTHENVRFEGMSFCLTGNFDYGDKSLVEGAIASRGGQCLKGVSKKCDYVVIGNRKDDRWSYGTYGNKVKRALELQHEGHRIKVINECDIGL